MGGGNRSIDGVSIAATHQQISQGPVYQGSDGETVDIVDNRPLLIRDDHIRELSGRE